MVTSSHEAMHRIFQEDPGIFARTFDRFGLPFAEPIAVSLLPTDTTEIKPLERRLDTLLQLDTADGESYLLAIEAQGRKDPDKGGSWAYYLAYLHAKYRKQPILLVTCQDEHTAQWAEGSSSYFAASVGAVSAATVERYINTQWERPWKKGDGS